MSAHFVFGGYRDTWKRGLREMAPNQGDQFAPATQVPDAKTATRFWRRCRRRYEKQLI